MTADLYAFLTARLDEDEAVARAADTEPFPDTGFERGTHIAFGLQSTGLGLDYQGFALTWDPPRVLAEIKAKRGIVDRFHRVAEGLAKAMRDTPAPIGGARLERDLLNTNLAALHLACKLIALPYASHSDYDASWSLEP